MKRDILGNFEYQVLGAVQQGRGDAYGASIYNQVESRTGRSPSIGAIYITLERLQEKGFVSSQWGEKTAERGGRRKRLYRIQAPGIQALLDTEAAYRGFDDALIPGMT